MSAEPYVVRRFGFAQALPLAVFIAVLALYDVIGLELERAFLIAVGVYLLVNTALTLDRLRIDEKGVRMRPAGRIRWEHIEHVSARDARALAVRLKPGAPLPRGIRGMADGEITLPARGFELDTARVSQAVRAYSEAGGSFSGRPGNGASSSGMSAGGPSG